MALHWRDSVGCLQETVSRQYVVWSRSAEPINLEEERQPQRNMMLKTRLRQVNTQLRDGKMLPKLRDLAPLSACGRWVRL